MLALWHTSAALGASLGVQTAFPTDVGLRGVIEGPARIRVIGTAGLLPRPYLDAINRTATSRGWYDDSTAGLVDAALQDAVVLRLHLGWRPIASRGLQLAGGYSWIGLGGGVTGAALLEAETGYDLSDFWDDAYSFDAAAGMHRAELTVGWEHPIGEHLLLHWDLGGSYTFSANADVSRTFAVFWPLDVLLDDVEDDAADSLTSVLQDKVHTPVMALGISWRFR